MFRRIFNLFSRSHMEREIDAELRSHIEMRIEDNIASGMSPDEARRDAHLRFGNLISTKEHVTHADATLTLYSIWLDIRFGRRQLRKNFGFSCTAILVLSLGMCASVALFAFVDAVLIRPLPYQSSSRLVALFESTPLGSRFHLSYLDYLDWKKQNKVFESLEAYDKVYFALNTATETQLVDGATVSAGFFRTLGVTPVIGRDFREGEDTPSVPRTVMLSYAAWQSRYGGRQDVLERTLTIEGVPYVVIGVLPREFHFAPAGPAEFWTSLHESSNPNNRGNHGLLAIARLKNNVSVESAASDMTSITQQLAKQYPDSDEGRGATVLPLTEVIVGRLRPVLWLLLCGATLLLLIACVNVSGLILVRSENRRHETAVRAALGASRMRLIRQFATEGVILAAAGSLLGISATYGAISLLLQLVPVNMLREMPYLQHLGLTPHVLLFAALVGLVMATLFSLTPILCLSLSDMRAGLVESGRSGAKTAWKHLGANLVVLELCTAMVLLAGAGLLGKSFYRLLHADIGIEPDHLAMMRLRAPHSRYPKDEQIVALAQRFMDEAGRLPGVQSVAVAHQIPAADIAGGNTTFEIIGRPQHGSTNESSGRQVSANYFNTMQARLARGRYFAQTDDASKSRVMIVNQAFARKFFPGEDAIGKHIRYDASTPPIEIVGIVNDIKEGPLDTEVQPVLYTPFSQEPDNAFYVILRTAHAPQELLQPLERTAHSIDPNILTFGPETMDDRISHLQSTYLHRSSACLIGGFAGAALLLGVVGLYGVIAYSVSQRTKEIGVRMALGAQRHAVYRLILKEAGRLAAIGISTGILCSVATASLIRNLLFGTQPWDAATLAGVSILLATAALLASYIPARRAASVNPVEALRAE
ncbi:ABC transporter permease [Terriglobus albidus]|uniref:ABC transporter permease n=1 Tax=Terriglobus albidus TaxID=1592106 RepID=UPI0021E0E972|nr:ABC transporter permease [Terriglobus albidus]